MNKKILILLLLLPLLLVSITAFASETQTITKEVEKTKELELNTNIKSKVLSNFSETIPFNDGEYTGELKYDIDTLKITPIKHGTYEKIIELQKEYLDLDSMDLINIPKEITDLSTTYILTNCIWSITENEDIANVSIPKKYKAFTIYKAVKTMEYPYTYNCSIIYKGTVSKAIEIPTQEPLQEVITQETKNNKTPILPVLGGTGVFILIVFLVFPNAKIKNFYDGQYKTVKYIRVSAKNPKVNLKYLPSAKSNIFTIEFNERISKKLHGDFVTLILPKGTIKKLIIDNTINVNI